MDKKLLVNGGLLAVAVLAAGYVYSDKIANTLGVGHKPDVQVEESVDKKEDKTTSKITEVKKEATGRSSQSNEKPAAAIKGALLKDEFLNMQCPINNHTYGLREVLSLISLNWKCDYRPDDTIVIDLNNSAVLIEFKKYNGQFKCVSIKDNTMQLKGDKAHEEWCTLFGAALMKLDQNMSR